MALLFVTIDRFEADKAVLILPSGQQIQIERSLLQPALKPGDVLELKFKYSALETAKRAGQAKNLLNKLKQNSHENPGNIRLEKA
jgi:hypothetical protein